MKKSNWKLSEQLVSNLIVVFAGIGAYVMLINFAQVRIVLQSWLNIISPFVWGLVLAYLLDGPVRLFEKHCKLRRGVAIALSYVLAAMVLCFLLGMVVPQVAESLSLLVTRVPEYLDNFNKLVNGMELDGQLLEDVVGSYQQMLQKVGTLLTTLLPKILDYGMAIGSGVINGITAIISSVYMLMSKERLLRQMRITILALLPVPKARKLFEVCSHANYVFGSFVNGKILDSAIIGVICFACTVLLNIPFAMLISVIVGVTNIIPFFGPFIGAVPSILILLIVDPVSALKFGIFVIVLQQFDGNILGPKILGNSTGLSALWVLVAIIVCGGLFGFVGMVAGVPFFAVLYALASSFFKRRLREKGVDDYGNTLSEEGS